MKVIRHILPFEQLIVPGSYDGHDTGPMAETELVSPCDFVVERIVVQRDVVSSLVLCDVVYTMAPQSGKKTHAFDRCYEICDPIDGTKGKGWRMVGFPGLVIGETMLATYPLECLPTFPMLEEGDRIRISMRNPFAAPLYVRPHLVGYRAPKA